MPDPKECPLCGTTMRLKRVVQVVHVPGHRQEESTRNAAEWICPECDYFEEAEGEGA